MHQGKALAADAVRMQMMDSECMLAHLVQVRSFAAFELKLFMCLPGASYSKTPAHQRDARIDVPQRRIVLEAG